MHRTVAVASIRTNSPRGPLRVPFFSLSFRHVFCSAIAVYKEWIKTLWTRGAPPYEMVHCLMQAVSLSLLIKVTQTMRNRDACEIVAKQSSTPTHRRFFS